MTNLEEVRKVLEESKRIVLDKAEAQLETLKPGEVLELSLSGWIIRDEEGYHTDIWKGFGKATSLDFYSQLIRENANFLDIYAKTLTPTRLLLLLRAFGGASETELGEAVKLRGGALHYHLRDLIHMGLLRKEGRGFYRETKYAGFVVRSAVSAIRNFKWSVEEQG